MGLQEPNVCGLLSKKGHCDETNPANVYPGLRLSLDIPRWTGDFQRSVNLCVGRDDDSNDGQTA